MTMQHTKVIADIHDRFDNGARTVGVTAVALTTASNVVENKGVLIKSSNDNTGKIYVGNGSDVTIGTDDDTDGFELGPGEAIEIEIDNTNKVFLISDTAAQTVTWLKV